jgi:dephospho-CoA kinase
MVSMIRMGLTGGIGMGKSMAAKLLAKRGAKISDSDETARALVEPGQPALGAIAKAFGRDVLQSDGSLNRSRVAELVFGDDDARKRLEGILHPRIRETWQANLTRWACEGAALGVAVIPLLYETGCEESFDKIICVACSPESQRERLRQRDWSEEEIARRISAQLSVEEKMKRADYVVWTDGLVSAHEDQWDELLARWSALSSTEV